MEALSGRQLDVGPLAARGLSVASYAFVLDAGGKAYLVGADVRIPLPDVGRCVLYALTPVGEGSVGLAEVAAAEVALGSQARDALASPVDPPRPLGSLLVVASPAGLACRWADAAGRPRQYPAPAACWAPFAAAAVDPAAGGPPAAGGDPAAPPEGPSERPAKKARRELDEDVACLQWLRKVLSVDSSMASAAVPSSGPVGVLGTLAGGSEGGLVFETKGGGKLSVTEAQLHSFCARVQAPVWIPMMEHALRFMMTLSREMDELKAGLAKDKAPEEKAVDWKAVEWKAVDWKAPEAAPVPAPSANAAEAKAAEAKAAEAKAAYAESPVSALTLVGNDNPWELFVSDQSPSSSQDFDLTPFIV